MSPRDSSPPGSVLDAPGVDDLVRRWQGRRGQPAWRPIAGPPARPPRRSASGLLSLLLLPLGLLAVFACVAGIRAAMEAGGRLDALQWLRLALLVIASAIVLGQTASLFARMSPGRALVSRLTGWRTRVEAAPAPYRPPLLDTVPLATLRRLGAAIVTEPARPERIWREARRAAASATWWVLVTLSLALSLGSIVLLGGLVARDLVDGRAAGGWLLLPVAAIVVAALGLGFTLRTARRSLGDRRHRNTRHLFRRIAGWISRGSPASGLGSGTATDIGASGATGLASTGARGRVSRLVPGLAHLGAIVPGLLVSARTVFGGAVGGARAPHDRDRRALHLGAMVAALFLGLLPWGFESTGDGAAAPVVPGPAPLPVDAAGPSVTPGPAAVPLTSPDSTPVLPTVLPGSADDDLPSPLATPASTAVVPGGGSGDALSPDATAPGTPDDLAPLPIPGVQPTSPIDDLADPSTAPGAPTPGPTPGLAPSSPTPIATPTPTATAEPVRPTETPAPEPTPVATPTPLPSPEPTEPPRFVPPPVRDPDPPRDPLPTREPESTPETLPVPQ